MDEQLKISLSPVRLTGDQSQRLLFIARERCCEIYEYHDRRLQQFGLVAIGPVPPAKRRKIEHEITVAWRKIQQRLAKTSTISTGDIKTIEHQVYQVRQAAYKLEQQYVTLTKAGRGLAAKGRVVIGKAKPA